MESSSSEDEDSRDRAKLYCEALTKLTPDIVPVLRTKIGSINSKCFSEGIIGEDMYTRGITLQDDSHQTRQLLVMVSAQIKV